MKNSTSIMDLPRHIVVNILLQLHVMGIAICKSVCKTWYEIISEPQFSKLYNPRAYPLVRPLGPVHISRTLYLVDHENLICDSSIKMSLETKFKIPLHNFERLLEKKSIAKEITSGVKRKRCLRLKSDDHKFDIYNSCNGFLCLGRGGINIVCNPVTGEYVNLPAPSIPGNKKIFVSHGLGMSSSTKSYMVIAIYGESTSVCLTNHQLSGSGDFYKSSFAQLQILGSRSWETIKCPAPLRHHLMDPTYCNGTLNWFYSTDASISLIVSFDFDSRQFRSSLLPIETSESLMFSKRLGVLMDRLCYSSPYSKSGNIGIWLMNNEGSWTKIYDMVCLLRDPVCICRYQPIEQLENGAILLYHRSMTLNGFVLYDPETQTSKYFRFRGYKAVLEAIKFTPSSILFKDALESNELEVLNVRSRCGKLTIPCEGITPFLEYQNVA